MATRSSAEPVESAASSESSLGPDGNVIALLAYLFTPVTGLLVFLLEEDNEFARYHGAQSTVFGLTVIALYVSLAVIVLVVGTIVGMIPVVGFLFELLLMVANALLSIVLWLGAFLVWLLLVVKAYQGEAIRLPFVTSIAENHLL